MRSPTPRPACASCCPIRRRSKPLRKALEGKRGRGRVTLVVPMPDELGGRGDLARHLFDRRRPARHHRRPAGHRAGGGDLSRQPGLFEHPHRPPRRRACGGRGQAGLGFAVAAGAGAADRHQARHVVVVLSRLARARLRRRPSAGGAQHARAWRPMREIPLLRTVSLDRTFYAPITAVEYQRYAPAGAGRISASS